MLITCLECGLQVSDKAIVCPHCGYPMKPEIISKANRVSTNKRKRLPNGFGQISEIKKRNLRKPFRAMVTVGKTPTGRPISKPLQPISYFATYNEAYSALVEYNKNPYDLSRTMTVRELYEKWMEEYLPTISESAAYAVKRAWKYCSNVYDMRAVDVRVRHVKGCMEYGHLPDSEECPSARTKNDIKTLFNQMFDYALEYELVEKNYARSFTLSDELIEEITTTKNGHIPFTAEEIEVLWKNVDEIKDVDMILIQSYSGWRPQELCLIKLSEIDFEQWVFVGGMKTAAGKNRTVPIHTKIRDLIKHRCEEAQMLNSEYLFNTVLKKSGKIKHYTYALYQKRFAEIKQILNLDSNHRPHDGRKHFVTMAKKYHVDEYAIKYIVGHKITDITEKTYTKRELSWLQEEIEKIKE